MTDLALAAGWLGVLALGLGGCVALRALGVAATYVRDLLHIGTGIWVLGWPLWHAPTLPVAIVVATATAVALVPTLAPHQRWLARVEHSVTGDDEHWRGLQLYTLAYALLTTAAVWRPLPAAAALLALSLGDGLGGAVGRRFGRHPFQAPGGKPKSVEGSLVVALGATAGVLVAAWRVGVPVGPATAVGLGVVAAVAEALAPRGTDNVILPGAVWATALLVT